MQEEAVKRVREMQQSSRSIVNGNKRSTEKKEPPPAVPHPPQENADPAPKERTDPIQGLLGGLLGSKGTVSRKGELFNIGGIKIDEEKAMIGLLIYILYKQGSDVKLLLALGYLLL